MFSSIVEPSVYTLGVPGYLLEYGEIPGYLPEYGELPGYLLERGEVPGYPGTARYPGTYPSMARYPGTYLSVAETTRCSTRVQKIVCAPAYVLLSCENIHRGYSLFGMVPAWRPFDALRTPLSKID